MILQIGQKTLPSRGVKGVESATVAKHGQQLNGMEEKPKLALQTRWPSEQCFVDHSLKRCPVWFIQAQGRGDNSSDDGPEHNAQLRR